MSELIKHILTRRSVRKYEERTVKLKTLLKALDAARWAPSAHNAQPWRYIILQDPSVKKALAENMAAAWRRDLRKDGYGEEMIKQLTEESVNLFSSAPVILIACLSMEGMHRYTDNRRRVLEYLMAVQSVSASITNLLLALHALNLGASWFCAPLFCPSTVRRTLSIPEDVNPQALITVGYPDEAPQPPPRRNLTDVVFMNRWGMRL
ncbi:MAG: nitroreductase family protein [Candidatus Bathyarchaeia archaeon]